MNGIDAIETRGITVSFGASRVLSDVDLRVPVGTIHGLIGPNGSGKTTLLNVISGFVRQSSGEVLSEGRVLRRGSPNGAAARGIGRTFQSVRLFPRLSVRENIEVGALAGGSSAAVARRRGEDLIARLGLGRIAETEAAQVPYGSERLVSIARVLAGQPTSLLLDEPCAGLDERETAELLEMLIDVNADLGLSILVIEHDMTFISGLCSTVQVLANGRTIALGAPDAVLADQPVIDAYLGS
ncbi:MAG: ABC transporter ATP-binding protein [Leucobacter sp.]